jgi:uncharacterized membrane protein YfhO
MVRLLSLNHQLQTKDLIHGFCVPTKNYYETVDIGKALDKQTTYLRGLSSSSLSDPISPNTIYLIANSANTMLRSSIKRTVLLRFQVHHT